MSLEITVKPGVFRAMLAHRCKALTLVDDLRGVTVYDGIQVFEEGTREWFLARVLWIEGVQVGERCALVLSFDVVTTTVPSLPALDT